METEIQRQTVECCIVGGGPAGMMAGFLLARQGVEVLVLEKHADFLRDFRGDTVHPSTIEVLDELGLSEEFLRIPHTRMTEVAMETPTGRVTFADFTKASRRFGYVAFMPQWDFLNFLAAKAGELPSFRLSRSTEATGLLWDGAQVSGVQVQSPEGKMEVHARLVLAADGRNSVLRQDAGLKVAAKSPPVDVLWFRLSRRPDESVPFFIKDGDRVAVCINRGEYWQVAWVIPHLGFEAVKERGLEVFRCEVAESLPPLADRLGEVDSWDDLKLLMVRIDRLEQWYRPGLLFIGDAAHAMSPAGGVGINLAIQDGVAAANLLGPAFRSGGPTVEDLRRVQRRREVPARAVQAFQARILRDLYPRPDAREMKPQADATALPVRLVSRVPPLRHLIGRFIGRGIRPEHPLAS
ncbi:MAG TPA: FAD-dependent oxidoreductase [Actinomycetota bacterium]|nr:FAD-dependent oxidoreductase [Actinomycetota bacterium]